MISSICIFKSKPLTPVNSRHHFHVGKLFASVMLADRIARCGMTLSPRSLIPLLYYFHWVLPISAFNCLTSYPSLGSSFPAIFACDFGAWKHIVFFESFLTFLVRFPFGYPLVSSSQTYSIWTFGCYPFGSLKGDMLCLLLWSPPLAAPSLNLSAMHVIWSKMV